MRLLLFNLATDIDHPILGFTTNWICALAQYFEHIDIITMQAGRIKVPENVCVYSIGKEKGYSELRRSIEFYSIFHQLLLKHRYAGCFAHMMPLFATMAAPFLRIKKIPIVLWYCHKSVTPILRLATFFVDKVVTASNTSFRIQSSKVEIIGHGIDTDIFVPKKQENESNQDFTILTVGRLSPIKRVDLLIEAVALFRKIEPEIPLRFNIVGGPLTKKDYAYKEEMELLVNKNKLQDHIFFLGNKKYLEIVSYYQMANCFINMSETGSIDKAVLEAMSCGIPVITNAAFKDVLGDELAQSWVINWDAKELCERLLKLAATPKLEVNEIGKKMRDITIQNHSLVGISNQIFRIIEELNKLCN